MAATGAGNGLTQTAVSLTGLGTIANNSTPGVTAAFAIPVVGSGFTSMCDRANLQINITSATTGAGAPSLQGVFLVEDDGANFDPYGFSNSQLFPIEDSLFTIPLMPSTAMTIIKRKGLILPAVPSTGSVVKLVIFSLFGVSITVGSANLYCYGSSIG